MLCNKLWVVFTLWLSLIRSLHVTIGANDFTLFNLFDCFLHLSIGKQSTDIANFLTAHMVKLHYIERILNSAICAWLFLIRTDNCLVANLALSSRDTSCFTISFFVSPLGGSLFFRVLVWHYRTTIYWFG